MERPPSVSFSGHETFPFRYSWMKKGVDAICKEATIFSRDDAMTRLGVGKNMVRSIRHWCIASDVFEERDGASASIRPSEFGRRLLSDDGWDPFLEDPGTLWLLHWIIASNVRRCTTWFWA